MFRNSKKGFTIVELIIVIAVIAVLAAVLIPTFSNLIQQAQEAKDTALVSDLNKGLAMSGTEFSTVHEVVKAVEENIGINVAKITATATENEILFDSENNCFVYLKDNKINYIPDTQKTKIADNEQYKYWQFVSSYVTSSDFSQYLTGSDTKKVTVHAGFDVGDNASVDVTYTTESAQEVTIRTNGGTLTVNAAKANVKHYGAADLVDVQSVKGESFHEFGKAAVVNVKSGHFVAENTAVILNVHVEATTASVKQESGAKVIAYTKDESITSEVKVAGTETTITETAKTSEITGNAKESGVVAEGGVAEIDGIMCKTLESAIELATAKTTIKLIDDVTITEEQVIEKEFTLDFNGYVLTHKSDSYGAAFSVVNTTLTLVDSSSSKSGKLVAEAYGISSENNGTTVIDGATIESNYACLTGNNTSGNMNFTIKSGNVVSKYSEAVYMPGQGVLTISGGNIVGGISMRMGTLNMTGGTVSGLRVGQVSDPIGTYWKHSGSAWIGDAIYILAGTYDTKFAENNDCVMNITGGTIIGNAHRAVCVYDVGNNFQQKVTINISANVNVTGEVLIDRNITSDANYKRLYPVDVTIVTPTETLK